MDLSKAKIGTLLGVGMALIIGVMILATTYLNSLTNSAIDIIDDSTSRIFDVLTIQRDVEELFSALDSLVVVIEEDELVTAEKRIDFLFNRAETTLREGRERGVFEESELIQGEAVLKDTQDISTRIFDLKEEMIRQGDDFGRVYQDDFSDNARALNREFNKLRNIRFEILGLVNTVIIRSDNEFANAMRLVGDSQRVSWVIVGLSLLSALILAYFLVRFAKKVYDIKNEFIYIIAHDLRNPVTAILGYLDIIMTGKNKVEADVKKRLQVIEASAQRLRSQINNLLEVGRTESGFVKINLEPVPIVAVIQESVLRAKALAETKGMTINYEAPKDTNVCVLADKSKLSDVFDNLISNALKYNRENGSVTITTTDVGKKFSVSVSDTGYGIPEDKKDKIFKKYSRLDPGAGKRRSGTGLGLFTAKMSMEKMKGDISFKTKEGKGTTFTLTLQKTRQR